MATFVKGGTVILGNPPAIRGYSAAVGKKEGDGPLASHFDYVDPDAAFGQGSWENAEAFLQSKALELALQKAALTDSDIDLLFAGDLLNQCTATGYSARDRAAEHPLPLIGLYGACSTMAQSLALASVFVESGLCTNAAALTSSHYCSAERQFRAPLNYGGQRTPTAQWTATAAGCAIVVPRASAQGPPYVNAVTFGSVFDYGVKDATNMGYNHICHTRTPLPMRICGAKQPRSINQPK